MPGKRAGLAIGALLIATVGYFAFRPDSPPRNKVPSSPGSGILSSGQSLDSALTATPTDSVLRLGPGDFRLAGSLVLDRPIRLVGVHRDSTRIILSPAVALALGDGASGFEVANIEILVEPGSGPPAAVTVAANGTLTDARVRGPGAPDGCSGGVAVLVAGGSKTRIARTEVTGFCTAIQVRDSAAPEIGGSVLSDNDTGIRFLGQAGGNVIDGRIVRNRDGIVVLGQAAPTLERNQISDNRSHGLLRAKAARPQLRNNNIRNNLRDELVLP